MRACVCSFATLAAWPHVPGTISTIIFSVLEECTSRATTTLFYYSVYSARERALSTMTDVVCAAV